MLCRVPVMTGLNKYLFVSLFFTLHILSGSNEISDFLRDHSPPIWINYKKAGIMNGNESEKIARDLLNVKARELGLNPGHQNLRMVQTHASPAGRHFTFRPMISGIPVYGADITVTINDKRRKAFISPANRVLYSIPVNRPGISGDAAVKRANKYLNIHNPPLFGPYVELVIFNSKSLGPTVAYRIKQVTLEPFGDWELFINAGSGEVIQVHDRMRYQSYHQGKGMVFNPDPLTRARTEYGGAYSDNDDGDTPELNAARDTVVLNDLYFSGTNYYLQGPYCYVTDIEPPLDVPPAFASPDLFNFTRGQPGFESVMVYYHIDRCYRRLQALGFDILGLAEFKVDPHGFAGADNSHYSQTGNYCAFGEGGVDDAEDADVIWHEYTHAIQYHVSGDMIYEGETMAIMEGSADYWAASYSRFLSDYNWQYVYNWDGHNEYWEGRACNKQWHYPEDIQSLLYDGREYEAGQLWSSVLMKLNSELGRDVCDRLFIQTHYLWGIDPGFKGAAKAFIMADSLLNNGAHFATILYWFDQYGLVDMNDYLAEIQHSPLPDNEQTLGPFTVEAKITPGKASLDENRLFLFWKKDAASFEGTPLGPGSSKDYFTGQIPGSADAGWIHYYLSVFDLDGNEVTAPPGAPANYYSFYAGPDSTKPTVNYFPFTDLTLTGWPPLIRIRAADNLGIASATVSYYINQDQNPGSFPLDEEMADQIYSGLVDLPKELLQPGDSVFYRITVCDGALAGNTRVIPETGYFRVGISTGGPKQANDFEESGGGLTPTGDWNWGTPLTGPESAHSGQNVWATNISGRYANSSHVSSLVIHDINLSGFVNVSLSFYHWYETEKGFDGANVKISKDGGDSWSLVYPVSGYDLVLQAGELAGEMVFSGSNREWQYCQIDLNDYRDQTIQIKFEFYADDKTAFQGWYIDDVVVQDIPVLPAGKRVYAASGHIYGIPVSWYMPDQRPGTPAGENSTLLGYRIYRSPTLEDAFIPLATIYNAEHLSFVDSSAVPNRPYRYKLKAVYMDGESNFSNSASAISSDESEVSVYDHSTGAIEWLSVANNGNIGYTFSSDGQNQLGKGLEIAGSNVLNEGALFIGKSPILLSDAASNEESFLQGDFMPLTPIISSAQGEWVKSFSAFNDGYAARPLGIQVKQTVYARTGDKFILWVGNLINYSGTDISELILGFYFDWHSEMGTFGNRKFCVWSGELLDSGYLTDGQNTLGIVLLSHYNFNAFRVMDNETETVSTNMTKKDKWRYLNQTFIAQDQTLRDRGQIFSVKVADDLKKFYQSDSQIVAFAIITAESILDFETQCGRAFQAYTDLGYQRSGIIINTEDQGEPGPVSFDLSQNYPNPFNPLTRIKYQLPKECRIDLSIYNLLGQKIITLVSNKQSAGYYEVVWDGLNRSGNLMASGVYFYKLETENYIKVRKMLFLK